MKKIVSGILLIVMLCSLTACGGSPINGTWTYSLNGDTSTLKFRGTDKVVWTLEEDGEVKKYEGKFSYDEENIGTAPRGTDDLLLYGLHRSGRGGGAC